MPFLDPPPLPPPTPPFFCIFYILCVFHHKKIFRAQNKNFFETPALFVHKSPPGSASDGFITKPRSSMPMSEQAAKYCRRSFVGGGPRDPPIQRISLLLCNSCYICCHFDLKPGTPGGKRREAKKINPKMDLHPVSSPHGL